MEIYEKSSHNVSASSSVAWARRSIGGGAMASTHGAPKPRKQNKLRIADWVAHCVCLAISFVAAIEVISRRPGLN
jgi:hypothetical protein